VQEPLQSRAERAIDNIDSIWCKSKIPPSFENGICETG
jgi:hypothetical protein